MYRLSVPPLNLGRKLSGAGRPKHFVIGRMDGGNVWGRVTKQHGRGQWRKQVDSPQLLCRGLKDPSSKFPTPVEPQDSAKLFVTVLVVYNPLL